MRNTKDTFQELYRTLKMIKVGELTPPVTIELHLTNACNHACVWCIASEIRQNKWHMPFDEANKLIYELAEMKCRKILFSGGGDPLMYNGIEKLVALSASLGMESALITNGSLIKDDQVEVLAKNCSTIRISVDAGAKETYNKIHRPRDKSNNNFEVVLNNVRKLVRASRPNGARILLTYVLIEDSIPEVEKIINIAVNLGVDGLEFKTNHFWSDEEKISIYEEVYRLIKLSSVPDTLQISVEKPKARNVKTSGHWPLLWINGVIEANGDLFPCCHTSPGPEWNFGNIIESSFTDVWYGKRRKELLYDVEESLREVCPTCLNSPYNQSMQRIIEKIK